MNTELTADREQLKEQLIAERQKFRQQETKLAADAEATESKLRVELIKGDRAWQKEQTNASEADLKAAEAELDAERQKTAELAKEANINATELAATKRDSGRLEKQKVKLEKQVKTLKEEKTQLKTQVVGDGKIVEKLKSQLEKAEAIKKILTVNVKKLAAENKQLQQKLETPKSGIYVRQDVYRRQQAILAAFKKQKNAERVRRQVAVDMAEPVVKQELDGIQRMLNVDTLLSMDDEAQAMHGSTI